MKFLLASLLIFTLFTFALPAVAQTSSDDATDTGALNLEGSSSVVRWGLELPPHSLPELCVTALPQFGGSTWGTGITSTPATSDALVNAALSLRALAEGTTTSARALWGVLQTVASAGILVNLLSAFQAIRRLESDPGEALARWFARTTLSIVGMAWMAGASPWLAILFCNYVCSSWTADPATAAAQSEKYQIADYYEVALVAQVDRASDILAADDPTVQANPAAEANLAGTLRRQIAQAADSALNGKPASDAQQYKVGAGAIGLFVKKYLGIVGADGADLSGGGSYAKNYQALGDAMSTPPGLDHKATASAAKTLNVGLYSFSIEAALEIWGLPLAIGVCAAMFAWPASCGFPRLLTNAFTALLTLVISFAIASSLALSGIIAAGGGEQYNGGYLSYLSAQASHIESGDVVGAVQGTMSEGASLLAGISTGMFMNFLTGVSWQLVFVTALIIASPVIAAGLVKGGHALGTAAAKALREHSGGGGGWGRWSGGFGDFDGGASPGGSSIQKSRQEMME